MRWLALLALLPAITLNGYDIESIQGVCTLESLEIERSKPLEPKPTPYTPSTHIKHILTQYDWNVEIAYKIMMCESSGYERAVGDKDTPYYSYGLFQIRALPERGLDPEWLFIPENNIQYAYDLWKEQGWRPWWNCSKKLGII